MDFAISRSRVLSGENPAKFHGPKLTLTSSVGKRSSVPRLDFPLAWLSIAKVKLDVHGTKRRGRDNNSARPRERQITTTFLCLAVVAAGIIITKFCFLEQKQNAHTVVIIECA